MNMLSHHRRTSGQRGAAGGSGSSTSSGTGSRIVSSSMTSLGLEEDEDDDVWKLDDSDTEDAATRRAGSGAGKPVAGSSRSSSSSLSNSLAIAQVAEQAGLGRKASANNLKSNGSQHPPAVPQAVASPTKRSLALSSLSGKDASNSSSSASNNTTPRASMKERGRQASTGFWERFAGVGSGSGGNDKSASSSSSAGGSQDLSGYSRFNNQLELEDNFDGTYSVRENSTGSGLLAPASISRPPLLGGGIRQLSSNGKAGLDKGKSRSTETSSPGGATIVGTPAARPRSPLYKSKSERPRDDQDMKRAVRRDIEAVMKDPVNLLQNLQISVPPSSSASSSSAAHTPTTPGTSKSSNSHQSSDYYDLPDSPNIHTTPSFSNTDSRPRDNSNGAGAESYDAPYAGAHPDSPSGSGMSVGEMAKSQAQARRDAARKEKFIECLKKETVDIAELRKLSWSGIPPDVRPIAWQLLLGYLPSPSSRRVSVLARKRQEYADAVRLAFSRGFDSLDAVIWHQIQIDVPRTNPGVPLWQFSSTQRSLEKILYVWAIRHPASGYVQGINDLATPFFQVFLSSYIDCDPEDYDISALPPEALSALEADTFWCLSKLLDGIQDNYIFAQPGIHRQVARCQELCARVDAPLSKHLENENISFLQFSFRWFHLLFLRVLPVNAVIRMWDTYMGEGSDAFATFHTYVCLAFLLRFSEKLRSMDFQAIMLFLQDPIEHDTWTDSMTELLLSEAYMWSALWSGTRNPTGSKS